MVSCIMPTCNRRRFVADAIADFLRQDYPHVELLILDDGTDMVKDCVPDDPRIVYFRSEERLRVGEKRNRLCHEAKGEIILHWDDDDIRSPEWISLLVGHLQRSGADVTGLENVRFFNPVTNEAWEYRYAPHARPWVHGGTMCYRKSLWEKRAFEAIDVGEDARFLWSFISKKVSPADCMDSYLAQIHETNVSPKLTGTSAWHRISPDIIMQQFPRPLDRQPH